MGKIIWIRKGWKVKNPYQSIKISSIVIPFKNIKKCAVVYKWITIIKEIIGAASESLYENIRAKVC
ncbi:TPA: hypothetical protein SI573_004451 [Escherichia coli]|uniref:hypothetical protein n=1 Tax=Escherichia coli TaxID=562 RepID=UPI00132BCB78|nr:hypothetical protein [Escherichia coli]EHW5162681.1 hypothetical protein [Escherichia coli]ELS6108387.1 hypothetical protein [Escherichia coli]MXE64305.1 hypothetical protein [Escherichia coli]HEI2375263.1 hypothetical protein [Escherichia coli]HEI2378905.1 hypothetical protein [Escherichia coli]